MSYRLPLVWGGLISLYLNLSGVDFSYWVSQKIRDNKNHSFSSVISRIAVGSIGMGVAVIILSFAIFEGFIGTIQQKIFSFSAHIQIEKHDLDNSYENLPLSHNSYFYQNFNELPEIASVQSFARKSALIKTDEEVLGVLIKGVSKDFDSLSFRQNMLEGNFPVLSDTGEYSLDVLLSRRMADKLRLAVNDKVLVFFVQNPPRYRKVRVSGIYETGIEEFDDLMVMADLRMLQRLNNWPDTLVGGFEVFLKDFNTLDRSIEKVYDLSDWNMSVEKVTDRYRHFFDWFKMLNRNVYLFLVIILCVASFNIISILLILIMERSQMIGMLKALGATNGQIKKIFIFNGAKLIFWGLIWGNLLGIGLGLVQQRFHIIALDPQNYYMNSVPILFDWPTVLLINLMSFILVAAVLLIPTTIISNIKPIKAIKFD